MSNCVITLLGVVQNIVFVQHLGHMNVLRLGFLF